MRRVPAVFRIQAPFGTDIFKVIATPDNVDFRSVLFQVEALPRGERAKDLEKGEAAARAMRGRASPLARLLLNASTGRRGSEVDAVDVDYWGTAAVLVESRAR